MLEDLAKAVSSQFIVLPHVGGAYSVPDAGLARDHDVAAQQLVHSAGVAPQRIFVVVYIAAIPNFALEVVATAHIDQILGVAQPFERAAQRGFSQALNILIVIVAFVNAGRFELSRRPNF